MPQSKLGNVSLFGKVYFSGLEISRKFYSNFTNLPLQSNLFCANLYPYLLNAQKSGKVYFSGFFCCKNRKRPCKQIKISVSKVFCKSCLSVKPRRLDGRVFLAKEAAVQYPNLHSPQFHPRSLHYYTASI